MFQTAGGLSEPSLAGRPARLAFWMLGIVALLAYGVYANSLRNGFAFDDIGVIRDNPQVTNLDWSEIWTSNYWQAKDGMMPDVLYRPVTLWSYLVNQWFTPGVAWPFHLVNVLLHVLVSVWVCVLAWRLLGDRAIAFVTGILFAVHPVHTEAIANVVGRAELLATAWTLLALLVYLPTIPLMEEEGPARRPLWHGWLVGACFFVAMLCKETPAMLLVAIPSIDVWRWLRWSRATRPSLMRWLAAQSVRYYLPMGLFFALYLAMRIHACGLMTDAGSVHPVVNPLVVATSLERMVTPFALLARYLALLLWPAHLAADYSAPSIMPTSNPLSPAAAAGLLTCLLALVLSVRTWRRLPQLSLLVGLFFAFYFLVSNAIRIGTIFGERLIYWPSAFVLMLAAWGSVRGYQWAVLYRPRTARWAAACALSAVVIAMGGRTRIRNTDWVDNITLAIATGRDNPASAKACFWAGSVLVLADRPDYVKVGKELLERAVELYPRFGAAQLELAKYYGRNKDSGNALIALAHAAREEPGTHSTRFALAGIFADLQAAAPESYMPALEEYQKAHPDDPAIYYALALADHAQAKYDLAGTEATQALVLAAQQSSDNRSAFHEAAAEIGSIEFDRGNKVQGMALFRGYVMRVSRSVDARLALAKMLLAIDPAVYPNALAEAEMNLDRADAIESGDPRVREMRAQVMRQRRESADGKSTASALAHSAGANLPDIAVEPGAVREAR